MAFDSVLVNDIDNDFNNANNWDGGVPATGETILLTGDYVITTNVARAADTNDLTIYTDEGFTGQFGTASAPLTLGVTAGSSVLFNSPGCKGFHISADIAVAYALATHPQAGSFSIEGGTTTLFIIHGGAGATLAAAGTYTTVIVDGSTADLTIENGNAVTTQRVLNGVSRCATTATNSYVSNGTLYLLGPSKTYAVVELHSPNALVNLECPLGTVSQITAYAGIVDGRRGDVKKVTVSAATAYSQAKLLYGGAIVETAAAIIYGGAEYQGYGAPDYRTPLGGTAR